LCCIWGFEMHLELKWSVRCKIRASKWVFVACIYMYVSAIRVMIDSIIMSSRWFANSQTPMSAVCGTTDTHANLYPPIPMLIYTPRTPRLHKEAPRVEQDAILELATNFWLLVLSILHNHKCIIKQASLSHWVAEYNLKASSASCAK